MSKPGRKRKFIKREPNGRASRVVAKPIDPRQTSLDARARIYGLALADAATDLAGTAVGRMLLSGAITYRQYDAAGEVAKRHRIYARALSLQASVPAVDHNRVHGLGGDMSRAEAASAIERWDEMVSALDEQGRRGALYGLIFDLVITDRDPRRDVSPLLYRVAFDSVADLCGLHMDKAGKAA